MPVSTHFPKLYMLVARSTIALQRNERNNDRLGIVFFTLRAAGPIVGIGDVWLSNETLNRLLRFRCLFDKPNLIIALLHTEQKKWKSCFFFFTDGKEHKVTQSLEIMYLGHS